MQIFFLQITSFVINQGKRQDEKTESIFVSEETIHVEMLGAE